MATRKVSKKQVIDYHHQLITDLKQKYNCTACGYTLSGELQIWFQSKICIELKSEEPSANNYEEVLSNACKVVDTELKALRLKIPENEKEV